MKRTVSLAAAFLATAAIVGCAPKAKDDQGAGATGLLNIELRATQPGVALEETRAGYGFSVNELGSYKVGPGPTGETIEGFVSPAELGKLLTALNGTEGAVSSQNPAAEEEVPAQQTPAAQQDPHQSIADLIIGEETVTVSRGTAPQSRINASSTGYHFQTATRERAEALHKAIRDLAARYYPDQFPGECASATAALLKEYPKLQGCQQNSDCSYVHWDFTAAEGEQYVSTDTCKWARPLIVGNAASVEAAYDALVASLTAIESACQQRTDCSREHVLTSAAPVCDAGVCKANPALSF